MDQGLFYWLEDGHLAAVLVCHVDDILWGGTPRFKSAVIDNLGSVLKFGAEHSSAFTYIGIQLEQHSDFSIMLNQNTFAASIKKITLVATADANTLLTDTERTALRSAIGQLNWLAGMSRPEISFEICNVASKVKEATIRDAIQINKVITRVQSAETHVTFPPLDLNSVRVKAYADGSFNSLPDGGSQGGQIVFICDKWNNSSPISWSSTRLRHVVRSAVAAETLVMCDGCELAFYVAELAGHILSPRKDESLKVHSITDSRSLYESLGSTKLVSDKRLRVEISALRQMVNKGEVSVEWVEGAKQLADVLTKQGVSWKLLQFVLREGKLSLQ